MLLRVDEVDAAVVRAAGPVPGQARLRVHGAVRLRRDEVESPDMSFSDEDPVAESGGAESIRVDVDEDLAAALAALGQRADLHDLARGADRDVAVGAVVASGDDFSREEGSHAAQPGDRGARSEHRPARVEDDPDLAVGRRDSRLIDETEQSPVVAGRLLAGRLRGRVDVRDDGEGQTAVGAERDGNRVLDLKEVGHEQIPKLVEGEARVAARVAQGVVVAHDSLRPGRTSVEADRQEHPRGQSGFAVADVGENDDVVRIRRIDRDGFFGFVKSTLTRVHVDRRRSRARLAVGQHDEGRDQTNPSGEKQSAHRFSPFDRQDFGSYLSRPFPASNAAS